MLSRPAAVVLVVAIVCGTEVVSVLGAVAMQDPPPVLVTDPHPTELDVCHAQLHTWQEAQKVSDEVATTCLMSQDDKLLFACVSAGGSWQRDDVRHVRVCLPPPH